MQIDLNNQIQLIDRDSHTWLLPGSNCPMIFVNAVKKVWEESAENQKKFLGLMFSKN